MTDNTFRASVDVVGNQLVTVRGIYEHTQRRGSGFSEDAIEDGGSQPGLRFYDEADRDRDKGTLVLSLNPVEIVEVTFSVAAGTDIYKGPGHEFGLLDNTNTAYNAGVNVNPMPQVSFGANYGRDHYDSNQKSRNANPPPDPTFNDPARDWTLANTENVNNFALYLQLPKVARNTNAAVTYDYSDSDNGFVFGGPRISSLTAIGQFIALPNVTNKWQRLAADVQMLLLAKSRSASAINAARRGCAAINLPAGRNARINYLSESNSCGSQPYKGTPRSPLCIYSQNERHCYGIFRGQENVQRALPSAILHADIGPAGQEQRIHGVCVDRGHSGRIVFT